MRHIVKKWNGDDSECGQYSVAMATDKDLTEVYQAVGRRGGTNEKLLMGALERLGFEYHPIRVIDAHIGRGIAIIQNVHKTRGHAVAWENGKVYDPDGEDCYDDLESMMSYFAPHGISELTLLRVEPVKTREFEVGGKQHAEV